MLANQLRSHIRWRSTENLLLLPILAESSKPEVNDLDHVGLVLDEYVVKFDVSVRNATQMEVVEGLSNLLEEAPANILLDLSISTLLLNILVK